MAAHPVQLIADSNGCLAVAGFGMPTSSGQIILLILAIGGLTVVLLNTRRKIIKSRHWPQVGVRERYAELQRQSSARRDMEEVMIQLDQLARQIHGQLDTRFAKLEAAIRDADERIDRLTRLLHAAEGGRVAASSKETTPRAVDRSSIDITLDTEDPNRPTMPDPASKEGRHEAIYKLADAGLSTQEIAAEAGQTAGEVELILSLRKLKTSTEKARDITKAIEAARAPQPTAG